MSVDIKSLTLEEKLRLLTGEDFWRLSDANGKLPRFFMADGPNGLRKIKEDKAFLGEGVESTTVKATAMPSVSTLAKTWNERLSYLGSATIADECVENDVQVLLAPGINIKRTPLCGRNFEYFSEDPYLTGRLAYAYVLGAQDKGVGTSLKHYCVNNRECQRMEQSSEVDERTLREIYTLAFEMSVKAKPWLVMCSYNPINGVFASENKPLLDDLLRGEFGFDGVVVSDWGATTSRYKCLKAGLDLQMPFHKDSFDNLKNALDKGYITEQDVDQSVQRLLDMVQKSQDVINVRKVEWTKQQRHANALEIAKEGIVLLKNDGALPLTKGKVVVGTPNGFTPVSSGTGSAKVQSDYVTKPLWQLLTDINGNEIKYEWAGYNKTIYEQGINADTILICVNGADEGEGYDRETIKLNLRSSETIVKASKLRELGKKVVVLVYAGSAIDMSEWIDLVDAVVLCGFGGECADEAVASVLTGQTCPSGKLAETFPLSLQDTYCGEYRGDSWVEEYNDRIFVGYRYYDKYDKKVLFPFGYGLSYANFDYSNLKIEKTGDTDFTVSYDVTNSSNIDAKEVSQVYVKDYCAMVVRPEKELKGFSKDLIKAGETKRVTVKLDYSSFAYYSTVYKKWHVENGDFEIMVGASSRDIKLSQKVNITLDEDSQNTKQIVYC